MWLFKYLNRKSNLLFFLMYFAILFVVKNFLVINLLVVYDVKWRRDYLPRIDVKCPTKWSIQICHLPMVRFLQKYSFSSTTSNLVRLIIIFHNKWSVNWHYGRTHGEYAIWNDFFFSVSLFVYWEKVMRYAF